MKPIKEKLISNSLHSFRVKKSKLKYFDSPWHYHEDYELFYIIKSCGKRFVGDSIEDFYEGDLVFIGPNLPHVWQNSENHINDENCYSEAIVVQFKENSFGNNFFNIAEMEKLKKLMTYSKRGLVIKGKTKEKIISLLTKIVKVNGLERFLVLLQILNILSTSNELSPLACTSFEKTLFEHSSKRLFKVFEYVANNFDKNITLEEISKISNMTKTAFCRFFKQHTLKTFFEYLNEVRIGYASKLLLNNDYSLKEICIACGINSPSYLIRLFKITFNLTPNEYKKKFKSINIKY